MPAPIIDIDTTVRPFATVQPTRYTQTDEDTVRVSVALELAEWVGNDKYDQTVGVDVVTFLDGETSDSERTRIIARVVRNNKYVTGFTVEPTVDLGEADDGTPQYQVSFTATTNFGDVPVEVAL
jgi:hypothetical protein